MQRGRDGLADAIDDVAHPPKVRKLNRNIKECMLRLTSVLRSQHRAIEASMQRPGLHRNTTKSSTGVTVS